MKSLLVILVVLPYLACNSPDPTTVEEEVMPLTNIDTEEVSEQDIPEIQTSNPGEVSFKLEIIEGYDSGKDICDVSREHVYLTEIVEIVERGMGITHMPHTKERMLVNFVLEPKELTANSVVEAKARESLCLDTSKSYFTIISYKILE